MKTFFKVPHSVDQVLAHRKAFEAKTGVKWDAFSARGGMNYTAIVTKDTGMDENLAIRLLPYLDGEYQHFAMLVIQTGMSFLEVTIAAKTLVQTQRAVPSVNRMGHFAYIRAKHPWEK